MINNEMLLLAVVYKWLSVVKVLAVPLYLND